MKWQEKLFIGTWIGMMLTLLALIPVAVVSIIHDAPPVQKVNKQCCSANECAKEHHHEKIANEIITNRQLQLFYDDLNQDYYLGQLSKNVEVKWGDLTANNWVGYTESRTGGGYLMIIDRATNPTAGEAYLTVAHETCHIKTWGQQVESHGSKFQNCMVNLATHGAFEGLW